MMDLGFDWYELLNIADKRFVFFFIRSCQPKHVSKTNYGETTLRFSYGDEICERMKK